MPIDRKQQVEDFFLALSGTAPADAIARFCKPGHSWWVPGLGDVADRVPGLLEAMIGWIAAGKLVFTVHSMVAEGDVVCAEVESFGALRNGRIYNNHYHFLVRFDGEMIGALKEYNDTRHGLEVWSDLLAIPAQPNGDPA